VETTLKRTHVVNVELRMQSVRSKQLGYVKDDVVSVDDRNALYASIDRWQSSQPVKDREGPEHDTMQQPTHRRQQTAERQNMGFSGLSP
jgi:hypothetical protein